MKHRKSKSKWKWDKRGPNIFGSIAMLPSRHRPSVGQHRARARIYKDGKSYRVLITLTDVLLSRKVQVDNFELRASTLANAKKNAQRILSNPDSTYSRAHLSMWGEGRVPRGVYRAPGLHG